MLYASTRDEQGIATRLENLAKVVVARGRGLTVLRLLASAEGRRRAHGLEGSAANRDACERAIAAAREQLDVATADAAWSDGATMTLEQAITEARAEVADRELR
jgi:hypothetical protein